MSLRWFPLSPNPPMMPCRIGSAAEFGSSTITISSCEACAPVGRVAAQSGGVVVVGAVEAVVVVASVATWVRDVPAHPVAASTATSSTREPL